MRARTLTTLGLALCALGCAATSGCAIDPGDGCWAVEGGGDCGAGSDEVPEPDTACERGDCRDGEDPATELADKALPLPVKTQPAVGDAGFCWDLDGNEACDPGEDDDGDGACNDADCEVLRATHPITRTEVDLTSPSWTTVGPEAFAIFSNLLLGAS